MRQRKNTTRTLTPDKCTNRISDSKNVPLTPLQPSSSPRQCHLSTHSTSNGGSGGSLNVECLEDAKDSKFRPDFVYGENSFLLSRVVFLRFMAFIYFVAFWSLAVQVLPLLGSHGLAPAHRYLTRIAQRLGESESDTMIHSDHASIALSWEAFLRVYWRVPTLFWLDCSDSVLQIGAYLGMAISAIALFGYALNAMTFLILWLVYMSYVRIGQVFWGYGWESQTLETGFIAIWMAPLLHTAYHFCTHTAPSHVDATDNHSHSHSLRSTQSGICSLTRSWWTRSFSAVSFVTILCCWWLEFRIMIGAGLIKIRSSDSCWRDLTCLDYFYETAPQPNPVSWYVHQMPHWFHASGVMTNHIVELAVPWLLFLPFRRVRAMCGIVFIGFQAFLIATSNLSFLNWLTAAPALMMFDDAHYATILFDWQTIKAAAGWHRMHYIQATSARGFAHGCYTRVTYRLQQYCLDAYNAWKKGRHIKTADAHCHDDGDDDGTEGGTTRSRPLNTFVYNTVVFLRFCCHALLLGLIGYLSVAPVQNLMSQRQIMNTSFDSFSIVNTYGAFGVVSRERIELVIQGTTSKVPQTDTALSQSNSNWIEYEIPCKPGDVTRMPCIRAPFHSRLAWQIWSPFVVSRPIQYHPWLLHLMWKLLHHDPLILQLFEQESDAITQKPQFVRIVAYKYTFTSYNMMSPLCRESTVTIKSNQDNLKGNPTPCQNEWHEHGHWWHREYQHEYLPPVSIRHLSQVARQQGWDYAQ
jgi:Lipase maturation factor